MRITTGEDGATGRHAQRIRRVGTREYGALPGQAIHRGSMDILIAHPAAHDIGRLLIGDDEHDVGPFGGGSQTSTRGNQHDDRYDYKRHNCPSRGIRFSIHIRLQV